MDIVVENMMFNSCIGTIFRHDLIYMTNAEIINEQPIN